MIAAESIWEEEIRASEFASEHELKGRYLECLGQAGTEIMSLREAIKDLAGRGVRRKDLVQWAAEAGYSTGYVRSLLSRILRDLALPARKPGAGRKVPREALALRLLARKHYGQKARKFLLAAYRALEEQLSSGGSPLAANPRLGRSSVPKFTNPNRECHFPPLRVPTGTTSPCLIV